jgi:hypothetical protein
MKMRITRIAGCWYDKARGDQDFRSVLERSIHYTRFLPLPPMQPRAQPAVAYLPHCTIDIDSSMPQINKKRHRTPSAQKKTPPQRWRKKLPEVLQSQLNH